MQAPDDEKSGLKLADDRGQVEATAALYGINKFRVKKNDILTKNIFTNYVPISASIYLRDRGMEHHYLQVDAKGELELAHKKFEDILGVKYSDLPNILWESPGRNKNHVKSIGAPGFDMMPYLGDRQLIELEVKLTVIPAFAEGIVTEMIVRQNTQFGFAERLCYDYDDLLRANMTLDDLRQFVKRASPRQKPFIVHGLWQTQGRKYTLHKKHTMDVMIISDIAYLKVLLGAPHLLHGKKTRVGRVLDLLTSWITEFKTKGTITYKGPKEGSKDHLKNTLYLVKHLQILRDVFCKLRLDIEDMKKIVPKESIQRLAPERRLDASLVFTLTEEEFIQPSDNSEENSSDNSE